MSSRVIVGDCRLALAGLPTSCVHCCVTSPPYFGLRDYGMAEQIGLEPTPELFVAALVGVFREVWRVLRDDGTVWLNLGDSYASVAGGYGPEARKNPMAPAQSTQAAVLKGGAHPIPAGLKAKDLIGIPWRVALALQADGWYLRQDIVWSKTNPMPESVTDRCTKSHEYLFLLSKEPTYFCDMAAIAEPSQASSLARYDRARSADHKWADGGPGDQTIAKSVAGMRSKRDSFKREASKRAEVIPGQSVGTHRPDRAESEHDVMMRNKRSVWSVATKAYSEAHFATFPPDLVEPCIKAGCPVGGTVLDPFLGAGTTALVADRLQRDCIGIELNPEYADLARRRIEGDSPLFAEVSS